MKERALRIGRPTPLIGIVSEPEVFDPARPAVIILNSGIMHHVGACRLSVKLARAVAASSCIPGPFRAMRVRNGVEQLRDGKYAGPDRERLPLGRDHR